MPIPSPHVSAAHSAQGQPPFSLQLSPEAVALLRLLEEGTLAPVSGFLGEADYRSVLIRRQLTDGAAFPLPVVLPVADPERFPAGCTVLLRDRQNRVLAHLVVAEVFALEPGCAERTVPRPGPAQTHALSGRLEQVRLPAVPCLRASVATGLSGVRAALARHRPRRIFAVGTEPVAGASAWLRLQAVAEEHGAFLLWQVFGASRRADDFERFRELQQLARACEAAGSHGCAIREMELALTGSPDMLLLRAIIHRNYGADTMMLTRSVLTAQALVTEPEISGFSEQCRAMCGLETLVVDDTPAAMAAGQPAARGCCVWLTGLSGAGKSSVAEQLVLRLMQAGRRATLLDGDIVRTHLSRGLTFSPEDRHTNICRIGYVASEIVRHEGFAVCAVVSPYAHSRAAVRGMMPAGSFLEVFVDTPLEVCEQRDTKELYSDARSGRLAAFTGITDVYERPAAPEIHLCNETASPEENAATIVDYLTARGLLRE